MRVLISVVLPVKIRKRNEMVAACYVKLCYLCYVVVVVVAYIQCILCYVTLCYAVLFFTGLYQLKSIR